MVKSVKIFDRDSEWGAGGKKFFRFAIFSKGMTRFVLCCSYFCCQIENLIKYYCSYGDGTKIFT